MRVKLATPVFAVAAFCLVGASLAGGARVSVLTVGASANAKAVVNPKTYVVERSSVDYVDSQEYTVAPGDSVSGSAYCPKNTVLGHSTTQSYFVVGGGYVMGGAVGLSIASATASYPTNTSNGYRVVVSNPKAAAGDVTFLVRAACLLVSRGQVGNP